MGKRELVALLNLSSWCLVMVERLFLVVPWGCLQFVIVVFPVHTHLLFFKLDHCLSNVDKSLNFFYLLSLLYHSQQVRPGYSVSTCSIYFYIRLSWPGFNLT